MLSFGDSSADRACNLECVEHLPPVHEFVGPVKIVLMDVPKSIYTKKKWISAAVGIAEMLIGATFMTIMYYTLAFSTHTMMNLHIVLCTIGFQLLMPVAILMQNSLHGPSAILKQSDRKCQHLFLQVLGMMCGGAGAVLVLLLAPGKVADKLKDVHCIAGLVTCGLAVLAFLIGPGAYCAKRRGCLKGTHAFFGILTFLASSTCFCIGVFTSKSLKNWVPLLDIVYLLIVFCCIYTLIVLVIPCLKLCNKDP